MPSTQVSNKFQQYYYIFSSFHSPSLFQIFINLEVFDESTIMPDVDAYENRNFSNGFQTETDSDFPAKEVRYNFLLEMTHDKVLFQRRLRIYQFAHQLAEK